MNQQNNMNLILQAPKQHAVPSSAIESIAALAGGRAERIADDRVPDADAWRVAGVSQSKECKMFYFKDIEKANHRYYTDRVSEVSGERSVSCVAGLVWGLRRFVALCPSPFVRSFVH